MRSFLCTWAGAKYMLSKRVPFRGGKGRGGQRLPLDTDISGALGSSAAVLGSPAQALEGSPCLSPRPSNLWLPTTTLSRSLAGPEYTADRQTDRRRVAVTHASWEPQPQSRLQTLPGCTGERERAFSPPSALDNGNLPFWP